MTNKNTAGYSLAKENSSRATQNICGISTARIIWPDRLNRRGYTLERDELQVALIREIRGAYGWSGESHLPYPGGWKFDAPFGR